MAKLYEFHSKLLLHPPYSPDLAAWGYYLFKDLKRIPQGKRFGSNEEVIAETSRIIHRKICKNPQKCLLLGKTTLILFQKFLTLLKIFAQLF